MIVVDGAVGCAVGTVTGGRMGVTCMHGCAPQHACQSARSWCASTKTPVCGVSALRSRAGRKFAVASRWTLTDAVRTATYLVLRRFYRRLNRPVGERLLRWLLYGLLCRLLLGRLLVRLRVGLGLGLRACRHLHRGGEPSQHVLAMRTNTAMRMCRSKCQDVARLDFTVLHALKDFHSSFAALITSTSAG